MRKFFTLLAALVMFASCCTTRETKTNLIEETMIVKGFRINENQSNGCTFIITYFCPRTGKDVEMFSNEVKVVGSEQKFLIPY